MPELELPEAADPRVVELVTAIRDRFGLRGLRSARGLIDREIDVAEQALVDLTADTSDQSV